MDKAESIVLGAIDRARVRGLLFDVDGTLSDTDDHMVEKVSKIFSPVSFLFKGKDPRRFARWMVMAVESPANFFYGLADKIGLDTFLASVYNWFSKNQPPKKAKKDHFKIIPGVREMLETLSEHYPLGVVSARDAASTQRFLEYFELVPYFKTIVTAQTCKHTKPFPDPVICAARELGLDPAECLMIGDTIVDVRAGNLAGAQTTAVLCGFGKQRELEHVGADLILTSTPDLVNILLD